MRNACLHPSHNANDYWVILQMISNTTRTTLSVHEEPIINPGQQMT